MFFVCKFCERSVQKGQGREFAIIPKTLSNSMHFIRFHYECFRIMSGVSIDTFINNNEEVCDMGNSLIPWTVSVPDVIWNEFVGAKVSV